MPHPKITPKWIFKLTQEWFNQEKELRITASGADRLEAYLDRDAVKITMVLEQSSVVVKTDSVFGIPPDHPAIEAIAHSLRERTGLNIRAKAADGLVLYLEFKPFQDWMSVNGEKANPYHEEYIEGLISSVRVAKEIVIENYPYLAGMQTVLLGSDRVVLTSKSERDQSLAAQLFPVVITRPSGTRFQEINLPIYGDIGTETDDLRLLPGFFIDEKKQLAFAPRQRDGTLALEGTNLKPFFSLLESIAARIDKLDTNQSRQFSGIRGKIERLLGDKPLIGTRDGDMYLGFLNSDVRDLRSSAEGKHAEFIITAKEAQELQSWRDLMHETVEAWTLFDATSKARIAAQQVSHFPKVIEAEKRRISRSGGGFSVYVSPSEAQITGLKNEISVELVEEGNSKYLSLKPLS